MLRTLLVLGERGEDKKGKQQSFALKKKKRPNPGAIFHTGLSEDNSGPDDVLVCEKRIYTLIRAFAMINRSR